ncbi:MAG TPA: hypothetical protein VF884_01505 [Nitrososphaeraceae archaeon]
MPLSEKSIDIIKESLIHYYEELVKLFSQEELTEGSKVDLMKERTLIGEAWEAVPGVAKDTEEGLKSYSYTLNNPEYNRVIHAF